MSLPDIDTAVGDAKTARQVFDDKSAALAHRQTPDVGMDHRTVDGEILQFGPDVDQVHIGEIHPVRRIAVLQPFHAEIQPIRFQTLDLQPEFSLRPGLVLLESLSTTCLMFISPSGVSRRQNGRPTIRPG